MQVENDYDKDVYNGDLGRITCVDPVQDTVIVDFDGRAGHVRLRGTGPAGAGLRHDHPQVAGVGYPVVVVPISTQHYPMLQRNLVYTAVTRGRKLVVIVGEKKALAIAVRGRQAGRRWSKLRELLGTGQKS